MKKVANSVTTPCFTNYIPKSCGQANFITGSWISLAILLLSVIGYHFFGENGLIAASIFYLATFLVLPLCLISMDKFTSQNKPKQSDLLRSANGLVTKPAATLRDPQETDDNVVTMPLIAADAGKSEFTHLTAIIENMIDEVAAVILMEDCCDKSITLQSSLNTAIEIQENISMALMDASSKSGSQHSHVEIQRKLAVINQMMTIGATMISTASMIEHFHNTGTNKMSPHGRHGACHMINRLKTSFCAVSNTFITGDRQSDKMILKLLEVPSRFTLKQSISSDISQPHCLLYKVVEDMTKQVEKRIVEIAEIIAESRNLCRDIRKVA